MTVVDLRHHKADYGYDGDYRAVVSADGGDHRRDRQCRTARVGGQKPCAREAGRRGGDRCTGVSIVTTTALFIRTTRVGKFEVWAEILEDQGLRGDETLLDLGCGRGAVLLAAAKLLPNGRAIGVDIWRADQTDNSQQNTLRNAELEGVAERVEVRTADITDLPFDDNSLDVIVSSLVVHNIPSPRARAKAISEAARVLRPGGHLVLADIWATAGTSASFKSSAGPTPVAAAWGWRMWWGPGLGTRLVTATKPYYEAPRRSSAE